MLKKNALAAWTSMYKRPYQKKKRQKREKKKRQKREKKKTTTTTATTTKKGKWLLKVNDKCILGG